MVKDKFGKILENPPQVHLGGRHLWTIDPSVLIYLRSIMGENTITLETGLGLSTLLFATVSKSHTCVVPDKTEVALLKEYCKLNSLNISEVNFEIGFSQDILPNIKVENLDCVLIDGGHGFPIPFIDYAYVASKIKIDGFLIVDDLQIWTGKVLNDFLLNNPSWVLERRFPRTAIFRKIGQDNLREWNENPYDIKKSRKLILQYRIKRLISLLLSGQIQEIIKRFRKH